MHALNDRTEPSTEAAGSGNVTDPARSTSAPSRVAPTPAERAFQNRHGSVSKRNDGGAAIVTIETYHKPPPEPRANTATTLHPAAAWHRHPLARVDWLLAGVVFIAALAARMPFVDVGQTLLNPDEAIVGLMAQDIAAGERFPIYFYGQRYMGSLEAFVIAAVAPLFDAHIQALRFGPAIVFSLFAALQGLMLTRWFGRRAGLAGAALTIAASPMFMHWSISARGGYVEILLWGTALLWAYTEWFVAPAPPLTNARRGVFGFLLGSGLWINPSIALFVAPIVVHALVGRPLSMLEATPVGGRTLATVRRWLGMTTLPVVALGAVLLLNATWAVWVDQPHVRSVLLMGLLPKPAAGALLGLVGLIGLGLLAKRTRLIETVRTLAVENAWIVAGVVIGAAPAVWYTVRAAIGAAPLEPALPLGIRPLWLTGETLVYLLHGLPLLLAADPRPFTRLMSVGHSDVTHPLSVVSGGWVMAANWLVAGGLISATVVFVWTHRAGIRRLLRLEPTQHGPGILLAGAVGTTLALYVLGGCTMNFSTVRYLVPLWAFLPGVLASVWRSRRFRWAGPVTTGCLAVAWGAGQVAMHRQLGAPHALQPVADALVAAQVEAAVAEPLDAHLLSYLTDRRCQTAEFESFWMRLPHYQARVNGDGPVDYVVETRYTEWTTAWTASGWPGTPPPETTRFLWPRLRSAITRDPSLVLERAALPCGFERIRLRHPLGWPGGGRTGATVAFADIR